MDNMVNWLKSKQHEYNVLRGVEIVEVSVQEAEGDASFTYHPMHFKVTPDDELLGRMLAATVCEYVSRQTSPVNVLTTGFIYDAPLSKTLATEIVLQERGHYCIYMKVVEIPDSLEGE